MRSCLGLAGFANQEVALNARRGTLVLSRHDSRAAPQTVQTASPVCGTKNFSSVRLYSAPQLHCTIVAIQANMRFGLSIFQPGSYALCHEPLPPDLRPPE